jgi:hypothetical protein
MILALSGVLPHILVETRQGCEDIVIKSFVLSIDDRKGGLKDLSKNISVCFGTVVRGQGCICRLRSGMATVPCPFCAEVWPQSGLKT